MEYWIIGVLHILLMNVAKMGMRSKKRREFQVVDQFGLPLYLRPSWQGNDDNTSPARETCPPCMHWEGVPTPDLGHARKRSGAQLPPSRSESEVDTPPRRGFPLPRSSN